MLNSKDSKKNKKNLEKYTIPSAILLIYFRLFARIDIKTLKIKNISFHQGVDTYTMLLKDIKA